MSGAASPSPVSPEAFEELVVALRESRQVSYFYVSALAFLAYDIATVSSREIEFIWKAKWSLPKGLYFFARYYGILFLMVVIAVFVTPGELLSVQFCRHYLRFYSIAGDILFTTVVNVILILRLAALYKNNVPIICLLVTLLAGEFAAELYISVKVTLETWKTAYVAPPGVPITGCLAVNPPMSFTLIAWIPCLVLSAIFFLMTVVQVIRTSQVMMDRTDFFSAFGQLFQRKSRSPLLAALLRDGTFHFFFITAIVTVSTVTTNTVKGPFAAVGEGWLIAVYSVSGSRLILNLRESASRQPGNQTEGETNMQTFRVLEFSSETDTCATLTP